MSNRTISKRSPLSLGAKRDNGLGQGTVLTANGRAAIVLGLRSLGLPKEANILMPEWHCGSEVEAVIAAGGTPVFYRLHADMTADLEDVAAKIAIHAPWGLYCTHYFGYSQPLEALSLLANGCGAILIEDLALGFLSEPGPCQMGQVGDMTIYSLVKTVPLPDGGALRLKSNGACGSLIRPGLKTNLRGARNVLRRMRTASGPLVDKFAGADSATMDEWDPAAGVTDGPPVAMSAVSRMVLPRLQLHAIRTAHRKNYQKLWSGLNGAGGPRALLPALPDFACPAYFPAYVRDQEVATRALNAVGIESVRFWRRFHPLFGPDVSPHLTDLRHHVLRLPIHQGVDDAAVAAMLEALHSV